MNNPRDENYILNGFFISLKKLCTMSVYLRRHRLSSSSPGCKSKFIISPIKEKFTDCFDIWFYLSDVCLDKIDL